MLLVIHYTNNPTSDSRFNANCPRCLTANAKRILWSEDTFKANWYSDFGNIKTDWQVVCFNRCFPIEKTPHCSPILANDFKNTIKLAYSLLKCKTVTLYVYTLSTILNKSYPTHKSVW